VLRPSRAYKTTTRALYILTQASVSSRAKQPAYAAHHRLPNENASRNAPNAPATFPHSAIAWRSRAAGSWASSAWRRVSLRTDEYVEGGCGP
jgi:hypothetical protein